MRSMAPRVTLADGPWMGHAKASCLDLSQSGSRPSDCQSPPKPLAMAARRA
ncbi:hypothetical protein [uncultured Roseicyclus sp.]|uniref:hypothetical protein n=1 Tax=uncultured Roseicyclus sp. TaxID=543072 RepID=UPI0026366F82|nr:hypothetical protein [uncultured Roseicyclus sp.]